jgi:hypothetical protein
MSERPMISRDYYRIPIWEKITIFGRRLLILPCYILLYKTRRLIPLGLDRPQDIVERYFPKWELGVILKRLGLVESDASTAIKVLTYLHTLTGVVGSVTEMSSERAVRVETHCPAARLLTREFCRDVISCPAFSAIGKAINADLVHTHETFLSGGDDTCTLIFEVRNREDTAASIDEDG